MIALEGQIWTILRLYRLRIILLGVKSFNVNSGANFKWETEWVNSFLFTWVCQGQVTAADEFRCGKGIRFRKITITSIVFVVFISKHWKPARFPLEWISMKRTSSVEYWSGSLPIRWKEESSVFKCILYVQLHKDFSRNHTRHEYYHQRQQFFIHKEALSMRMLL